MNTIFYDNAKHWTLQSTTDLNNNKYLKSWMKALVPARLNYLADAIINIAMVAFNLLKAGFGVIRLVYTWGREIQDFKKGLESTIDNLNHIVSDIVGMSVSTNGGISLRDKNNFPILLVTIPVGAVFTIALINSL